MTCSTRRAGRFVAFGLAIGVNVVAVTGCGMLDVSNPTGIESDNLDNSVGAGYLWTIARFRFAQAANISIYHTALLTDEVFVDLDPTDQAEYALLDHRESEAVESVIGVEATVYGAWQILRRDATVAIPRGKLYGPAAHVGELYALRGYSALGLAEQICPGFPLREVVDLKSIYGPPHTTEEGFEQAVVDFDSALEYASDSARVLNLARLGKARALLGLGRFAEAGAAAAGVTDGYAESVVPPDNYLRFFVDLFDADVRSVSDREGGNGLDYVSAADPRVELTPTLPANWNDPSFIKQAIAKYPFDNEQAPIVVANDIEARLIQAEAQLQPATAPAGPWLATLNALRATVGLNDTTDPGTADGRVDLLFRERAFWLFATGHRLGDLRRLVAHYGRAVEDVFPTGNSWSGAPYNTATSLPFPWEAEHTFNPAVTGCTSR